MPTPAKPRMQCPVCGSEVHRSRRQVEEWPYRLIGMNAWLCLSCNNRFHARPPNTKPILRSCPTLLRIRTKLPPIGAILHIRPKLPPIGAVLRIRVKLPPIGNLLRIRTKLPQMRRNRHRAPDNIVPMLTLEQLEHRIGRTALTK